ncbi:MAG: CDP-diacylglycerol--glycerol-3-phosphate 3-phosphatidyltransferase [Pseudomonadales bacterium]|nr:CDP-diacylglycerol--glycerol-3-phosphate 3-phosphatidyltransferase [Pseudomonadales bacterium]MCP5184915.1 CDP-diacylglycerol--glycerol-3-phosphate 3-phosphatidyltransferase [Pseudomonadales bacterium]
MNLPNILTFARILLVPFFAVLYLSDWEQRYTWTAALFALAAFTDWLDGYIARKFNQTTPFGAFIDPVADKIIVATALVLVVGHYHHLWLTIPALVIVGREIVISALREWMAEMNRRGQVAVSWFGKVKTTVQMLAIVVLLATPPWVNAAWTIIGYLLLYAAAALTLFSMALYLRAAWPALKAGLDS